MNDRNAEPLLPVELGAGKVKFARGMKAGRWVFATGLMAQDFVHGIAPDVLAERMPHAGRPKREKETLRIYENLDAVLRAAGTDRTNLVRTDQYYTTVKAVPPYQQVRREFLGGRIPPSTSIAQRGMLLPGADMTIQALGVIPQAGFEVTHLKHEQLAGPSDLGLFAGAHRRRFRLHSGRHLACGRRRAAKRNGVAAAALMTEGAQWAGQPIKLETEFLITRRMVQSLALAGATLDDVVHAQVYLTDPDDYSAFNETWTRHFSKSPPTLDIIPCIPHGLAPYDGKIEINVIAMKGGAARKKHVDAGVVTAFAQQPQAVKAGDLLFMSGLMAIDRDGLVPHAAADPKQPYFSSAAEAQAEFIIGNIAKLCEAAGTSLRNVVRMLQFHTDLARVLSGLQGVGAEPRRPPGAVLGD